MKEEGSTQSLEVLSVELSYIRRDINEIKETINKLSQSYVTQIEFRPVKRVVYGMVTTILVYVLTRLLS